MLRKTYSKFHFQIGNIIRRINKRWMQYSISPEIATTIFGARFGENGWHHIRKTFEEIDSCPDIEIKKTSLYKYLKLSE